MANVGDKFIIEVDKIFSSGTKILYRIKGFNSLVFDENGIDKLEKPDESEAFKKGYAKAIEDIQKEQSEIRVGDEVKVIDFGCEAVVTCTDKHLKSVFVLYTDGSTDEFTDRTKLIKTGRHFDEIEKLIEILKGGEDSE